MAGRFEFMDQDGRATSLVRLQLWEQALRAPNPRPLFSFQTYLCNKRRHVYDRPARLSVNSRNDGWLSPS